MKYKIYSTYTAIIDLTTSGQTFRFAGPRGAEGKIVHMAAVIAVVPDGSDVEVRLNSVGEVGNHIELIIPTSGSINDTILPDGREMDASRLEPNEVHSISNDGAASSVGTAHVEVTIAWEKLGA